MAPDSFVRVSIECAVAGVAEERCQYREDQVDQANKAMASIFADGITDNSAPRETNRQIKELNQKIKQQTAIQLAIAEGCDTSSFLPNDMGSYITPALECATEQLKGNYKAASCEMSNWTRSEEE